MSETYYSNALFFELKQSFLVFQQISLVCYDTFSGLTLLVGQQEGHPACRTNMSVGMLEMVNWSQAKMISTFLNPALIKYRIVRLSDTGLFWTTGR